MRWGFAALFVSSLVCLAQQNASKPYPTDPKEIDAGRSTFRLRCSACHGIRAEGGRGPDLRRGEYSTARTDQDLFNLISRGAPGTEMPAFGERNTDESIWRIVAYLRSLTPAEEAVSGDPLAGEAVYWGKGGCGTCHRVGVRGGRFGPSLTRIGRTRSLAHLSASVVDPDADLPRGYFAVTVETPAGEKISGVGLNIDNFSVQFMDAEEQIHSYLKSETRSIRREFRSLMPAGYGESLGPTDLDDLLAYLAGLRGEEGER